MENNDLTSTLTSTGMKGGKQEQKIYDIMSPEGLILGVSSKLRYAQKPCEDI